MGRSTIGASWRCSTRSRLRATPTGAGRCIAKALGDVHVQYVWRFLRAHKIDLSGRKSWCESNDPDFAAKAAEIVGLYMAPPENAIVLAVDEKPSIQALERAQGYLKLPNGRAMTGQSHDYKRHGTTTLFAALDLASGKVVGRHYKTTPTRRVPRLHEQGRRRLIRSAKSMSSSTISPPTSPSATCGSSVTRTCISTYTPTHASWLNQIEIWFSILLGQIARRRLLPSVEELIAHIDAFIADYNETARPFVWTKVRSPPKTPQTMFRGPVIPGTRYSSTRSARRDLCHLRPDS